MRGVRLFQIYVIKIISYGQIDLTCAEMDGKIEEVKVKACAGKTLNAKAYSGHSPV